MRWVVLGAATALVALALDAVGRSWRRCGSSGLLLPVLAIAFGAGANTTCMLAVQGLRVLVMVLLAPLAVRRPAGAGSRAA
jgi:hypothetical protein